MKTMRLKVGNASRPVILDNDNYKGSIMEDPIDVATSIFDRLIRYGMEYRQEEKEKKKKLEFKDFERDWSFKVKNNVIPFFGDRGSGKTSCMLSVQKIVLEKEEYQNRILTMDVVDPSFFDEDHNILQLFVAQLYTTFISSNKYQDLMKKPEVLELKSEILLLQNNLKYLEKNKAAEVLDDDYALQLEALASGVYLQSNLRKVVRDTLNFLGKDFLLIVIDDLDINVNRAYEMMEQIRKYLIMPELVIMLSAKPDQLENSIRLHLKKIYHGVREGNDEEIEEMTEKYLSKFLPQSHRVFMSAPETLLSANLVITNEKDENIRKKPFDSVADGVLDLIFQKTRYLFYNRDNSYSYILPRNLRNLTMLIELLVGMEDHDEKVSVTTDNTDSAHQNIVNKQRFKDYLINDALNVLDSGDREMILSLYNTSDIPRFNKLVLATLQDKYWNFFPPHTSSSSTWTNIFSQDAKSFNVSLGDVLEVLNYLSQIMISDKNQYFLFAIQTLYSIRMYELYDEMTDEFNSSLRTKKPAAEDGEKAQPKDNAVGAEEKPKVEQAEIDKAQNRVSLQNNNLDYEDLPDFLKLLGGTVISFDRQHRLLQNNRDIRLLNALTIREEISKLVEISRKGQPEGSYLLPEELIPRLRVLEFMALCAAFHIDTRKKEDIRQMLKEYRTSPVPYFVKPFDTGLKNIVFSITKPLFSLIYPKQAYIAFGKEFWNLCRAMSKAENPSLLGQILYDNPKYPGDDEVSEDSDLASRASIRNMEILIDLYNKLIVSGPNKRVDKQNKGVPGMYGDFLKSICNLKWLTYSFNENTNEHHTIELTVLLPLVNVMESISKGEDEGLKELFEKCFIDEESSMKRAVPSKNRPEKDSPESRRFTPGFDYDKPTIRNIIFREYPDYKKEYYGNPEGKLHKDLTSGMALADTKGETVVRYLATIADSDHGFLNVIGEELQEEYMRLKVNDIILR